MQQVKPKILLFIDWYIPGYKAGGPIRSCANMIAALKDECDFYVVTRDSDYTENQAYEDVVSDRWQSGRWGEQVYFFSEKSLNRKSLRKLIMEFEFDYAYVNGIYSYYFSILPLILCRKRKPKKIIVATRGMLASSAIEVKSSKKRLFLNLARFAGIYKNVIFHATKTEEWNDIKKTINPKANIVLAENFPLAIPALKSKKSTKEKGVLKLINLARISPEKNLLFVFKCLKNIKGKVIFSVYGPVYDQDYFSLCKKEAENLPKSVEVDFKGALKPEMVGMELQAHDLFIMPSKGENFGHSISESLSNGTPVLISDQTPWNDVNEMCCGAALPLDQVQLFEKFIQQMLDFSVDEHQKWIDSALQFSAKKNDTTLLKEQYRLIFEF